MGVIVLVGFYCKCEMVLCVCYIEMYSNYEWGQLQCNVGCAAASALPRGN